MSASINSLPTPVIKSPPTDHPAFANDRSSPTEKVAALTSKTAEVSLDENTVAAAASPYHYSFDTFIGMFKETAAPSELAEFDLIFSPETLPPVYSQPLTVLEERIIAGGSVNSDASKRTGQRRTQPQRKSINIDRDEGFKKFISKVQTTDERPIWAMPTTMAPVATMNNRAVPGAPGFEYAQEDPADTLWFYRDPQGNIQGPFTGADMHEWYKAGFFTAQLLVKREYDREFVPLGLLVQMLGNDEEPFLMMFPIRGAGGKALESGEYDASYTMVDGTETYSAEQEQIRLAERQKLVGVLQQRGKTGAESADAKSWSNNGQPGTVPKSLKEIQEEEQAAKRSS